MAWVHFSRKLQYLIAVALVTAVTLVQNYFWAALQPLSFFLFFPTVFLAAAFFGAGPGIVATTLSTLSVWLLFMEPRFSYHLAQAAYVPQLLAFAGFGVCASWFGYQLRQTLNRERRARDLLSAEVRFRYLVEGVHDYAIFMLDPTGRVSSWNEGAQRINGYSSSEVLGKHFGIFYTPEELASGRPERELRIATAEGRYEEEGVRVRKDGTRFIANVVLTAIHDQEGKLMGFAKVTRDITERKEAEKRLLAAHEALERRVEERTAELRRSEEEATFLSEAGMALASSIDYEETLSSIAELAVPKLADWCVIDILETGAETPRQIAVAHSDPQKLKWAKELGKKYPPNWNAPTGAPAVIRTGRSELYREIPEQQLRASARDDEHFRIFQELQIRSAIVVPLISRGRTLGAITLISSLSGRHYGDRDLKIAEELGRRAGLALENAFLYKQAREAINSRDEFLSIASHELKTPITSLKLQLQMARRSLTRDRAPELAEKPLSSSSRQIDRLTALVEDLLDVSRIQAGKMAFEFEKMSLSDTIREVVERHAEQIASVHSQVELHLDESITGIWDRFRIEQVLVNLLTNAIKYAPGKPIEITTRMDNGQAVLEVSDQGPGIDPAREGRIFERFERATSARNISGLGLGLFIARQITLAHHGDIRVHSEQGKGTTFTLQLPMDSKAAF
ncbi:MAG: ATP-binding protein [Bdellovibrionota bacterium]